MTQLPPPPGQQEDFNYAWRQWLHEVYKKISAYDKALDVNVSTTSGETRFLLYDVDNATFEKVTVGAADSGGTNFKVLRIPN